MTRGQAVLVAAMAAPAAPAVVISGALVFSFHNGPWALVSFPLWYLAALLAELILGGPLLFIAWRFHKITWWTSALAGAVVGLGVLLILQSLHPAGPRTLALIGGLGAASGLLFWLVARLGRNPSPRVGSPDEATSP